MQLPPCTVVRLSSCVADVEAEDLPPRRVGSDEDQKGPEPGVGVLLPNDSLYALTLMHRHNETVNITNKITLVHDTYCIFAF